MMVPRSIESVILCGSGLALWMSAAALCKALPETVHITVVETQAHAPADFFYGQCLPPQAYKFHLSVGLSEPDLLLNSDSSFSYGIALQNWALAGRSWVQAFHQPLPIWEGVPFAKLIHQQSGASLQPYLVSACAAMKGVFAHPPEDAGHPLSRAEYGYGFDPQQLTTLYRAVAQKQSVRTITSEIESVTRSEDGITELKLADGTSMSADLYVDCTGPEAHLRSQAAMTSGRGVTTQVSRIAQQGQSAPATIINSHNFGWQSEVSLRSGTIRMTVSSAETVTEAAKTHAVDKPKVLSFAIGACDLAWEDNSIAIGQAACTLEPFTTAPIKLLFRDINRLIRLFPIGKDMRIEAKEYNRLFRDDCHHAQLFNQAHFALPNLPDGAYWQDAAAQKETPKLTRKLTQYESRGHLVAYDNEPFDDVDWAILHDGIGRQPRRRDPLAAMAEPAIVDRKMSELRNNIQAVTAKMPPHPIYMNKFLSYLARKFG